ncbi:cytochrome b5-like heme/steroid binding domain-containing protein [Aspergillus crustosus]
MSCLSSSDQAFFKLYQNIVKMGWLTIRRRAGTQHPTPAPQAEKIGAYSEHTEDITVPTESLPQIQPPSSSFLGRNYPLHNPSIPDCDLPYIEPSILSLVEKHWTQASEANPETSSSFASAPCAWVVVDNIVYDCTPFQHEHPGGPVVIHSFVGQDCSWQFWRFHSKKHLTVHGRGLRIGRTSGIKNRFKEPPRYVGLSSLNDDW